MTQNAITLILTHEHADFDAVASLLAVALITPHAVPVLPQAINRNVRGFLALYGPDLPFVERDEAPRRNVERVILVDTQSLPAMRGVGSDTPVTVIDHHPLSEQRLRHWQYKYEQVGACTTLIVETIAQQRMALNTAQSVLLLLGIYEDTGSLTYAGTTGRDARAVAYVLESGVDPSYMREFLHHPLSDAQRELYEQLRAAAQFHEIRGRTIVIAETHSDHNTDGIATVAQRLRDLLQPDAIFILVAIKDRVQLVARSQVDAVDVGAICEALGGGGHARAAAAIVRDSDLFNLRKQLLDTIKTMTHAVVTVSQIMSRGGQTLDANITISDAGQRMQRTGFEGYPVLQDGHVIGLLTRRAVDRALGHKMGDGAVTAIMEEGNVVVSPDDAVDKLERLMITHGWGQVPVVDKDKHVIGIVTRTDVLKLRVPRVHPTQRKQIAVRLERALDPKLLVLMQDIANAAHDKGFSIYFVGGVVRDLLLERPLRDVDLVVEGDAIKLAEHMARTRGGRVTSHARFGTAKWVLDAATLNIRTPDGETLRTLDLVSARTEFYTHPTALPQVERSSIKQDLHRRDFTINSMAVCLDPDRFGELLDFYGGAQDLNEGLIRVLHSLSFVDDPTRMLRAVRFEQRFGFHIDTRTLTLLTGALDLLDRVSSARIRSELDLIFLESQPEKMIKRLADLGVLAKVHASLTFDAWLTRKYAEAREAAKSDRVSKETLSFAYLALLTYRLEGEDLKAFLKRLKYARDIESDLHNLSKLRTEHDKLRTIVKASDIYRLLSSHSKRVLWSARLAVDDAASRATIDRFTQTLIDMTPSIDGAYLQSLEIKPGPQYGRILNALRDALLDGEVQTLAQERAFVEKMSSNDDGERS